MFRVCLIRNALSSFYISHRLQAVIMLLHIAASPNLALPLGFVS